MNDLISIIVPVYNVEKYIEKCINSLLSQTFKNIEIILVDDGSTDNSSRICDDFSKKDNRIVVIHQNNCGVSAARNAGIKISQGNYIGFVDSDDYVDEEMYSILYSNLIENDADISICSSYDVYESSIVHNKIENVKIKLSNIDGLSKIFESGYYGIGVWNKLFKRTRILNIFPENLKNGEELTVLFNAILHSKTIIYDSKPLYYYVQRKSSATHAKKVDEGLAVSFKHLVDNNYDVINCNKELKSQFYTHYILACFRIYNRSIILDNEKLQKKYKNILLSLKQEVNYNIIPHKKAFQLKLFYRCRLYRFIIKKIGFLAK